MNGQAKTVLVVDDESTLVTILRFNLERDGYRVVTALDGEEGIDQVRNEHPDLLILDLVLPKLDGFEVSRIIRRESGIPILILTGRSSETDKLLGFEVGADDYVTKPFSTAELLARVRALLKRGERLPETEVVASGDLRVDLRRRKAWRAGQGLDLTLKEIDLLGHFLLHPGRVLTREALLQNVWGAEFSRDSRTLDVHVRWLREKIEDCPGDPVRIVTVRGVGYRFEG